MDFIQKLIKRAKLHYSPRQNTETSTDLNFHQDKKEFNTSKFRNRALISSAVAGLVIIIIIITGFFTLNQDTSQLTPDDNTRRIEIKKPLAAQNLNKQFLYPLRGQDGKTVSSLKFNLQNIEKRDEIVIKGQLATSVSGRAFLIINLKITNDYNQAVQINARDYFRLQINNTQEKLAPDIHNDPVEVQAISTKYTRIGFPINDSDTQLTLQVGEISGSKESLKLDLK